MINLSSTTEVAVTQDSLFIHTGLLATIPTLNTAGSRLNTLSMVKLGQPYWDDIIIFGHQVGHLISKF